MTADDRLHHRTWCLIDRRPSDLQSQPRECDDTDTLALEEADALMLRGEDDLGADLGEVRDIGVIARVLACHGLVAQLGFLYALYGELHLFTRGKEDSSLCQYLPLVEEGMQGCSCRCRRGASCGEARLQREEVGAEALDSLTQAYGTVDVLVVLGECRAGDHVDGYTSGEGWSDLLLEEATLATLLRDHSVGLYLVEERLIFALMEVAYMAEGESCCLSLLSGVISIEDTEEALMLLPEGLEWGDGVHARQSKKPVTGLCFQLLDHLLVARAFDDLPRALAVLALVAEDGDAELGCHLSDGLVEDGGEGMGGVDDEVDILLADEVTHDLVCHGARDTLAVDEVYLLEGPLGGVIVFFAGLVEDGADDAALGRTSED